MKRYMNTIASKQQNGFVPRRSIFDNYNVTQLIQAYLDENDEDGLMIFLDIEKAFDSVSWDYMIRAMQACNVGPQFRKWVEMMYNPNDPPRRRVRINNEKGEWFHLQASVAQGCPCSALFFVFITEAFTRAVVHDKDIYTRTEA